MTKAKVDKRVRNLSNRGFSLIEILIAVALMSIISIIFTQMIVSQQNQSRSIYEKLAIVDLQSMMVKSFADPNGCTVSLADSSVPQGPAINPQKFPDPLPGAVGTFTTPTVIHLNNVFASATGSPPPFLVTTNSSDPASKVSQNLKITDISLVIKKKTSPNRFSGEIKVVVGGTQAVFQPAVVSVVLKTTTLAGVEVITACGGGAYSGPLWRCRCQAQDGVAGFPAPISFGTFNGVILSDDDLGTTYGGAGILCANTLNNGGKAGNGVPWTCTQLQ